MCNLSQPAKLEIVVKASDCCVQFSISRAQPKYHFKAAVLVELLAAPHRNVLTKVVRGKPLYAIITN